MHKLRLGLLVVVSCAIPMLGQSDKAELFGGYSLEHISPGCGFNYRCGTTSIGSSTSINGFAAALTGYLYKSFGVTAQFTGNFNGNAVLSARAVSRYTYQFGPAYSFHVRNANLFAHALFGVVNQRQAVDPALKYTKFLWSLGGGMDFQVSRSLSIRPVQFDYERQSVPVLNDPAPPLFRAVGNSGFRYSAGVVFHF